MQAEGRVPSVAPTAGKTRASLLADALRTSEDHSQPDERGLFASIDVVVSEYGDGDDDAWVQNDDGAAENASRGASRRSSAGWHRGRLGELNINARPSAEGAARQEHPSSGTTVVHRHHDKENAATEACLAQKSSSTHHSTKPNAITKRRIECRSDDKAIPSTDANARNEEKRLPYTPRSPTLMSSDRGASAYNALQLAPETPRNVSSGGDSDTSACGDADNAESRRRRLKMSSGSTAQHVATGVARASRNGTQARRRQHPSTPRATTPPQRGQQQHHSRQRTHAVVMSRQSEAAYSGDSDDTHDDDDGDDENDDVLFQNVSAQSSFSRGGGARCPFDHLGCCPSGTHSSAAELMGNHALHTHLLQLAGLVGRMHADQRRLQQRLARAQRQRDADRQTCRQMQFELEAMRQALTRPSDEAADHAPGMEPEPAAAQRQGSKYAQRLRRCTSSAYRYSAHANSVSPPLALPEGEAGVAYGVDYDDRTPSRRGPQRAGAAGGSPHGRRHNADDDVDDSDTEKVLAERLQTPKVMDHRCGSASESRNGASASKHSNSRSNQRCGTSRSVRSSVRESRNARAERRRQRLSGSGSPRQSSWEPHCAFASYRADSVVSSISSDSAADAHSCFPDGDGYDGGGTMEEELRMLGGSGGGGYSGMTSLSPPLPPPSSAALPSRPDQRRRESAESPLVGVQDLNTSVSAPSMMSNTHAPAHMAGASGGAQQHLSTPPQPQPQQKMSAVTATVAPGVIAVVPSSSRATDINGATSAGSDINGNRHAATIARQLPPMKPVVVPLCRTPIVSKSTLRDSRSAAAKDVHDVGTGASVRGSSGNDEGTRPEPPSPSERHRCRGGGDGDDADGRRHTTEQGPHKSKTSRRLTGPASVTSPSSSSSVKPAAAATPEPPRCLSPELQEMGVRRNIRSHQNMNRLMSH